MPGRTIVGRGLAHYRILEELGRGGMGIVYKALDTHLDRVVALKLLPGEKVSDRNRKRRFVREAKAASALSHPNIITIHDISASILDGADEGEPIDFIVMEYIKGRSLDQAIADGPLPVQQVLEYAVQIAAALAAAHAAGIVHRDIKPANIMVTASGSTGRHRDQIKILDFGLAMLAARAVDPDGVTRTASIRTEEGTILGTVAYMSPEQAQGKAVDARTDIFSFGCVLYEMLARQRPFQGDSPLSTLAAILHQHPAPLNRLRPHVPARLQDILSSALEKDRDRRYPSALALQEDLMVCLSEMAGTRRPSFLQKPKVAVPALALLGVVLAAGVWMGVRSSRIRWARDVALPEIVRLIAQDDYVAAVAVAREAAVYIPNDPTLATLWPQMSIEMDIQSTPPGAEVSIRDFGATAESWQVLGRTPISGIRLPRALRRARLAKNGYVLREGWLGRQSQTLGATPRTVEYDLTPVGSDSEGMVRVAGVHPPLADAGVNMIPIAGLDHLMPFLLGDYLVDQYEVTNKSYKRFVDAGGYRSPAYWKVPFVKDGRTLSFGEAVKLFVDATGRPGPSTWQVSEYPKGHDQDPVQGVSWYEAAAYAEFAGRRLPTVYHWSLAAMPVWASSRGADIIAMSNFSGAGPAPVGRYQGVSPFGTFDMAGNVKEWCWNETGGHRFALGGAWNEPAYMFTNFDAQSPFERSAGFGFRTVKYLSDEGLIQAAAPIPLLIRDYAREQPVSDEIFRIFEGLYAYDKTALNAKVESIDDRNDTWRREKVSFSAAYGNERVVAYLFLPKHASPPYQTVVYFDHAVSLQPTPSEDNLQVGLIDFFLKSGRAVLYPVYKGMYERYGPLTTHYPQPTNTYRDTVIQMSKDLRRGVDYLETRPEIDKNKLAYDGVSFGATMGPVMVSMEPRFKAAVFVLGGLYQQRRSAEVDQLNFAPRVRCPVLMINGRFDWIFPLVSSQQPMFRLMGTPDADKRHVLLDSGHSIPANQLIRDSLNWLDRYLGPVR